MTKEARGRFGHWHIGISSLFNRKEFSMGSTSKKMSAQEMVALNREYTFFSWSVQSATAPIPITRAEGVYFWDVDGRQYLDFSSQLMNVRVNGVSAGNCICGERNSPLFPSPIGKS